MSLNSEVRVRFPPSPTGYLHVGNLRTAVFNWLLARHHGGKFILRIEDTDRARVVPGAVEVIYETLRWIGIDWDEGPDIGGPHAPYVQSERKEIYREYAELLISQGKAYRCFCSQERLEALREEQRKNNLPTRYDRKCRYLDPEEAKRLADSGQPYVVRFATPLEGTTTMVDLLRGPVTYQNDQIDDFVILKSDGYPPYHFAVVVDDHLMGITHVLRGDEYISSGARDILLHEALGWNPPLYAHTAIILGPDRSRLSKRHGALPALEYRDIGIIPEAMFNYLALLGASYSADREIFSREELIELFDIDKMSPSPAIFDANKLEWMNAYYINHVLSVDDLASRVKPILENAGLVKTEDLDEGYLIEVIGLVKDRIKLLPDVVELTDFFFRDPDPSAEEIAGKKLTLQEAQELLQKVKDRVSPIDNWSEEILETELRSMASELGVKTGTLFMLIRVAITGKTASPGLFETMAVLGKDRTISRIGRAIDKLDLVAHGG